jgi:hypothetical protein
MNSGGFAWEIQGASEYNAMEQLGPVIRLGDANVVNSLLLDKLVDRPFSSLAAGDGDL